MFSFRHFKCLYVTYTPEKYTTTNTRPNPNSYINDPSGTRLIIAISINNPNINKGAIRYAILNLNIFQHARVQMPIFSRENLVRHAVSPHSKASAKRENQIYQGFLFWQLYIILHHKCLTWCVYICIIVV